MPHLALRRLIGGPFVRIAFFSAVAENGRYVDGARSTHGSFGTWNGIYRSIALFNDNPAIVMD